jgi:hypothetical protein
MVNLNCTRINSNSPAIVAKKLKNSSQFYNNILKIIKIRELKRKIVSILFRILYIV